MKTTSHRYHTSGYTAPSAKLLISVTITSLVDHSLKSNKAKSSTCSVHVPQKAVASLGTAEVLSDNRLNLRVHLGQDFKRLVLHKIRAKTLLSYLLCDLPKCGAQLPDPLEDGRQSNYGKDCVGGADLYFAF